MVALKSQRDEPNTLREYELVFIMRPNASSDQIQEINNRVRRIINEAGGKVLRLDNWGKRKLAYEIRKEMKGIYLYWLFLANAGLVHEIERNLRMSDLVIRHQSLKVDEDVVPGARPDEIDDETFAAAATLVPDEEDAYMGRTYDDDEENPADDDEDDRPAGVETPAKSEEVAKEEEPAGETPPPAEEEPTEEKPAEEKPAEEEPAEEKPAEEKPADEKPVEEAETEQDADAAKEKEE